ncbi:MAG TPA: hypothetical protein VH561_22045 [Micromonosporaceae bacterium]|jgi:hypothetical protein
MAYAANVGYSFTNLLGNVVGVVIKVVIFLVIMALGWLIATWIRGGLGSFLHRLGFERAAHRGGLDRLLGRYSASDVTAQLVALVFLLFVLQIAFGVFGPNAVSDLIGRVIAWLPKLLAAVLILVVTAAIAGWIKGVIAGALGGLSYGRGLATAAQAAILVLGIFAALTQIGVASTVITPVLWALLFAVTGVLVVGVGGGLIKPMQHRWERMLNRVETETTIAADRVRANQAARAQSRVERDRFGQPTYGGTMPTDERPPARASEAGYEEEYPEYTELPGYDR